MAPIGRVEIRNAGTPIAELSLDGSGNPVSWSINQLPSKGTPYVLTAHFFNDGTGQFLDGDSNELDQTINPVPQPKAVVVELTSTRNPSIVGDNTMLNVSVASS